MSDPSIGNFFYLQTEVGKRIKRYFIIFFLIVKQNKLINHFRIFYFNCICLKKYIEFTKKRNLKNILLFFNNFSFKNIIKIKFFLLFKY